VPSFASDVKNEIARIPVDRSCCQTAELAALLRMGAALTLGAQRTMGLEFATENAAVARKVLSLLKGTGEVQTEISVRRSRRLRKHNMYSVVVVRSAKVPALLTRLGLMHGAQLNMKSDSALLRKRCCQAAYLRGAFLGGGSVNRPEAEYHLELVAGSYQFAEVLLNLLRRMGLPAGITERKNNYLVYLKESDAILDFLEMIGAAHAAEQFEVARNLKEVRNQVNRLVNCETANVQRSVDAAGHQIEAIRRLQAEGAMEGLSAGLQETARLRLQHPDATLAELAALLGVGRSGVNHRLRKLTQLAEELL
jgi:DNA-binding protein WhiA